MLTRNDKMYLMDDEEDLEYIVHFGGAWSFYQPTVQS